jgi:hypothetical protein
MLLRPATTNSEIFVFGYVRVERNFQQKEESVYSRKGVPELGQHVTYDTDTLGNEIY